jgi:type I restriction enzyme, R subunit
MNAQARQLANQGNFAFLEVHDEQLVRLGMLAERYFVEDPVTSLIKSRQLGELLAKLTAARIGLLTDPGISQYDLLGELADDRIVSREVLDLLHEIRKAGNRATHDNEGDHRAALNNLKYARQLGIWFHRTFKHPEFKPGPFLPPSDPVEESDFLKEELQRLREERDAVLNNAEKARVAEEAAVYRANQAEQDRAIWEQLAQEADQAQATMAQQLTIVQAQGAQESVELLASYAENADEATSAIDLDEASTRELIDQQLRDAGWEVDTQELKYSNGTRATKGRNLAVAEWPTETGPADYVLFRGLTPLAVVEAKRSRKNVASAIEQSKRYSRGYDITADQVAPKGGPWADYKVPFLFATNGRPFLQQLKEQSGIWFLDAREPTNHPRPRDGWSSPDDLAAMLKLETKKADDELAEAPTNYLPLYDHQHEAVQAVEKAIRNGKREILVAMATGTGKTRTCIGLVYRLIKTKRFRRVLFLVDRTALGEQAFEAFEDVRLENQQAFTDIYDVKELGDLRPDSDTRLQIATVQGMVKRLLYPNDDAPPLSVDTYDCIVVDECHRGYALDREMSEEELTFRSEKDYISKYRRVLDHFDAVKIGLTATPALHTTEIFGEPTYEYSYRRAVVDGILIDHEPPYRLVTRLGEDGMHWDRGDEITVYNTASGQINLFNTPDEVDLEIEDYNKKVITEPFNQVLCNELARHIDPDLPGKTLIYCASDAHADMVVRLLKDAFTAEYGQVDDDAVQKITGAADKPLKKLRYFKNEKYPSVAVTVDLLTTGIDVPEIVNLVFIRRVKSRILYEQMLGRATRRCEGLFGDSDKEVFYIFDAVDLYSALEDHTSMKPVVQNPKISVKQLIEELTGVSDEALRQQLKDQLLVKLQRKRKKLERGGEDEFQAAAGVTLDAFFDQLRQQSPYEAAEYFAAHSELVDLLGRRLPSEGLQLVVSDHPDEFRRVERGYGEATKPEDYLESFSRYIAEQLNNIAALKIVTTRPRDLTRQQLKELKLALDTAGFSEAGLRAAFREATNQDIAASIIGYIRQRALGTPLEPYEQRVARALQRILGEGDWTPPQRQWLERIGRQITQEVVVDREALDQGQFGAYGGFTRLNKVFDGKMQKVLEDFHEQVWKETA